MVLRWLFLAWLFIPTLAFSQSKAPPAQPFQRYDGCKLKAQPWNDGDSFHTILPDGKEVIFRLYFVDTPESAGNYIERTEDQAAYFGISQAESIKLGKAATAFTTKQLSAPFTIYTRWRQALGRSKLPRYYAMVVTSSGHDLAAALVSNGLARIYGTRTPLPDGQTSAQYLARLAILESKAKAGKLGGWNIGSHPPVNSPAQ